MPVMQAFKQTSRCPIDSVASIKARHEVPTPFTHKTPAPGAYHIPGGIGEKAGTYKRAQGGRFGKETWGQDPEETEKRSKPAPDRYSLGSTMGRQVLSRRPSSPAAKMGGRTHIARKPDESFTCREDSFLRLSSSPNAPWAPQYTMAPKIEEVKADNHANPGPGSFDMDKYPKAVRLRFGIPVTMKHRHEVVTERSGPGPMRCRTDSSMGRQVVSTQKNGSAFSFGRRSSVRRRVDDDGPGPGAYG